MNFVQQTCKNGLILRIGDENISGFCRNWNEISKIHKIAAKKAYWQCRF